MPIELIALAMYAGYAAACKSAHDRGNEPGDGRPRTWVATDDPAYQVQPAQRRAIQHMPQPHARRVTQQPMQQPVNEAHAWKEGNGAYYVNAVLPSATTGAFDTEMQVDNGATYVTLSHADFAQMGVPWSALDFCMPLHAVSNTEYAAPILLPMMAVGKIRLDDVRAVVTRHDCGTSLLGNSALDQLGSYERTAAGIVFRR